VEVDAVYSLSVEYFFNDSVKELNTLNPSSKSFLNVPE
jgi:hypothetical protein